LYGLQLFNWVWQLYPNLNAFFTDEGILPRRDLLGTFADRFSVLVLFSAWWQVALAWSLSLAVALLLTVGWRSRLMSFLAFVAVSSWSWRDPLILDGSDFVFRLLPLWMSFTACGALWSVDAALRRRRGQEVARVGPSLPVRILELQVAWIYLSSGIEKLGGSTWLQGTAGYFALQLEHTFGRWWARPIATNLVTAALISRATLLVEVAFLPLAMIPSRITRGVAVVGAAGMHLGILTLMNVGNFPVIMLSTLVLFIPGDVLSDAVEWVVVRARPRIPVRLISIWSATLGRLETPIHPQRLASSERARGLGAALLVVVAATAFATAAPSQLQGARPGGDLASLLRFLSLDQRWDMFSPDPARADGWMVIPAKLSDGTMIDLLSSRPADDLGERWSDPLYSRWIKVEERIASVPYADYRLEYARQFCRLRNLHLRPGQLAIDTFEIHYVERVLQGPGEGPPASRDITLWSHKC
jgi:hypothetical protein